MAVSYGKVLGLALIVAGSLVTPALAGDAEVVEAAVLSALPADYDGKRIHTKMSTIAPLPGKPKSYRCEKEDRPYQLGGDMVAVAEGGPMQMLRGVWVLCVPHDQVAAVATAGAGARIEFEADVEVKGSTQAPKVKLYNLEILEITPFTTGVPAQAP